jgi:hypothetical protein
MATAIFTAALVLLPQAAIGIGAMALALCGSVAAWPSLVERL